MKVFFYFLVALWFASMTYSQDYKSIHQLQSEFYSTHPELIGKEVIKIFKQDAELLKTVSLSKIIYGFHPYWISDATAQDYYYSLLTHVAYFSAEVDNSVATTGGISTTHSWATTQVVNYTKNAGKKIHLTITMFDNHDRVLANAAYRTNLVNNILTQLAVRNGDGVNIDFEGVANTQAINFRTFVNELGTALKAINKELCVCLPAVDWDNVFPSTFFSTNNSVVDYYFIMLYGYWWSGSSTAGPISPLTAGTAIRHVTRSIDYYISIGATTQRLVSGFPYYGYDWPVVNDTRMAATTGTGTARTFSNIQPIIAGLNSSDKFFDATYNVPWYRYQSSGDWHQTWYDDSLSLAKKYDSIIVRNLAGTGMWALGYDVGYSKLWGAIKNKFASTPNPLFVNLDDFENSAGHFDRQPTYSGSTVGISTTSKSNQTESHSNNGWGSLEVLLKDSSSLSSNWTVRLLSGTGSAANNVTLNSAGYIGFWMKTSTAPSGSQIALTIDDVADGTELSSKLNVINDGNWNLYQWNLQGADWTNFNLGNGVINGPTATLDAIMLYASNNSPDWTTYFDDMSYYQNGPLPVEISSFTVSINGTDVILKWTTLSEVNSYIFEVQKKEDRDEWQSIGEIAAAGNSNSPKEYIFIDKKLSSRTYQYRLKMIDADGSFQFSKIVEFVFSIPNEFYLSQNYPNPFNPTTRIDYQLPFDSKVKIELYSITGERVATLINKELSAGYYTADVDASALNLASGVYIYRMTAQNSSAQNFVQVKKLMLMK